MHFFHDTHELNVGYVGDTVFGLKGINVCTVILYLCKGTYKECIWKH